MPLLLKVRVPWVGLSTRDAVNESASMSVSLVRTLPVTAVSSSVVNESPLAAGASLTGLTVMFTVAIELVAVPSVAV